MKRNGCSPEQKAACPLMQHYTDEHHLYHPRKAYAGKVARTFRNLPANKVQICRNEHNEIHATLEQPDKPTRQFMLQAIANSAIKGAPNEPTEMEQRLAVVSAERATEALGNHLAGEHAREFAG